MPCSFALLLWTGLSACSGGGSETAGKPDDTGSPITDTSGDSTAEDTDTEEEACVPTVEVGTRLEVREDCFVATITDAFTDTIVAGGAGSAASLTVWNGAFVADSDKHIIWSPAPIEGEFPSSQGGIEISEQYGYSVVADPIWTVGDFDGDGSPDAAMIDTLNSVLYAYRHPFEDQDDPIRWDWTCVDCEYGKAITAGDCDGDGVDEIVAHFGGPAGYDASGDPATHSAEDWVWKIWADDSNLYGGVAAPADLDGDGISDLVTGEWDNLGTGTTEMRIFIGPLHGVIGDSAADTVVDTPGTSSESYGPAFADVDGDGVTDVIQGIGDDSAPGQGTDTRSIYVMSAPPRGDVSMEDSAFAVLTCPDADVLAWGPKLASDDMNRDGFADVAATAWGSTENDLSGWHILLYAGPLSGSYGPDDATGRIADGDTSSGVGSAVAIGDVSDAPGQELLLSAKGANVEDPDHKGAVYIIPVFW